MKKTFIFFVVCLIHGIILGQTYTNDPLRIPEYIPPSPEAASFAKYGDIPVSEYTGTPDISIPIYTVKSGTLSLPITLNYHASGIQVGQEATWVGLGWDLMAGGAITLIPIGANDQLPKTAVPWTDKQKLLNYIGHDSIIPSIGTEDSYIMWPCTESIADPYVEADAVSAGLFGEGEPDVYNVNFLGHSFQFFVNPADNQPTFFLRKNKFKIQKLNKTFLITGDDGTQYYFTTYETDAEHLSIQMWYLTAIVSPDGHTITLNYNNFGIISPVPSFNEQAPNGFPPGTYTEFVRTVGTILSIQNIYLTSIETDNEKITFDLENRMDIRGTGAKRLKDIQVYDKLSNKTLYTYNFDYDYFTGSTVGGDYTHDDNIRGYMSGTPDTTLSKRLKLEKVIKLDPNNTQSEVYSFTYNDSIQLPLKTSFARDFWGYYNGQENNSNLMPDGAKHTLIPDAYSIVTTENNTNNNIPNQYLQYTGANRCTSVNNICAGMLQSIQYPTGGRTVFKFEPNIFGASPTFLSAEDRNNLLTYFSASVYSYNNSLSKLSATFTVNKQAVIQFAGEINGNGTNNTYTLTQLLGASIVITGPLGPSPKSWVFQLSAATDGSTFVQNGNVKYWNDTISLSPGNYILACSLPSSLGNQGYHPLVSANIGYYNYNASVYANAVSVGGGVRIKTITDYDANNKIVSQQKYTYSGGVLLVKPDNLKAQIIEYASAPASGNYSFPTYMFNSDSYTIQGSVLLGTDVGYSQVEVSNGNNGKEIYYFQNTQPSVFNEIPIFGYYTNGDLLKKIYLDANNDTVRVEQNLYNLGDTFNKMLNYKVVDGYMGFNECYGEENPHAYIGRFFITVYPIVNYWDYLSSKQTIDYINSSKIIKTDNYTYNPTNYCPNQIAETRSDGHLTKTVLTYPSDYSAAYPYDTMINRNMISPVVERSFYKDSTFLERTKTNYWIPAGGVPVPGSVEQQVGQNPTETRLVFSNYDAQWNPIYVIKDNAINMVYLWSYNYQYPVAKIEGLTYSQVVSNLTQAFIDTLSKTAIPTQAQMNTIRSGLGSLDALVTTYTYAPLIGMTSETNPEGVTTRYTYDTFGRLWLTRNDDKNLLARYRYGYQNAPDNGMGGYTAPSAVISTNASSYTLGATGSATANVSGGSGGYAYNWYLETSSGTVLSSSLNTTSTSFPFTCSQSGTLTVQCVVTDNLTGQTATATQTISCVQNMYNIYLTNNSGYNGYTFPMYIDGTLHNFPANGVSNQLVATIPAGTHTFMFPCGPTSSFVMTPNSTPIPVSTCGTQFSLMVTSDITFSFYSVQSMSANLTTASTPPANFCTHGCSYTKTVYLANYTYYYDSEKTQPVKETLIFPYNNNPNNLVYVLNGNGVPTGVTFSCP